MARIDQQKSVARRVRATTIRGKSLPAPVEAAMLRAEKGMADQPDMAVMFTYLGAGRNRAGQVRRGLNQARRIAGNVALVSSVAGSVGQGNAAATIAGGVEALNIVQALTKTKVVRQLAGGIGKAIVKDRQAGIRFLKSVSRGLALGGAIGIGAGIGVAAVTRFFKQKKEAGQEEIKIQEILQRLDTTPGFASAMRQRAFARTQGAAFFDRNGFIGSFLQGANAKADREIVEQQERTLSLARKSAQGFGINERHVVARAARRLNIAPENMRRDQINAALDAELNKRGALRVSPELRRVTVTSKFERLTPIQRDLLELLGEEGAASFVADIADDLKEKVVKETQIRLTKGLEKKRLDVLINLTSEDLFNRREAQANSVAAFKSTTSRHQVQRSD